MGDTDSCEPLYMILNVIVMCLSLLSVNTMVSVAFVLAEKFRHNDPCHRI
jgi:hypothetical protein